MAFKKKEPPAPDPVVVALDRVVSELRALRREVRKSAALGGILAKRGPGDGGGGLNRSFLKMAEGFVENEE